MRKAVFLFITIMAISSKVFCQSDTLKAFSYFQKGYEKHKIKDYKTALTYYDSSVVANINYTRTYFYRALVRYYLNDVKGSIDDYSRFISVSPTSSAYDNRGFSKFVLGDNQGALDDYNKSIA